MTTVLAKQPFSGASPLSSSSDLDGKNPGKLSEFDVDEGVPPLGVPHEEKVRLLPNLLKDQSIVASCTNIP
jgi:hypothetical protein